MSDEPDLRAILARRRLLVSAAATALGCTVPEERLFEKVGPRTLLPDFQAMNAEIPPYSVDPRVPEEDKVQLERFGAVVGAVYEKLERADSALTSAWHHPSDQRLVDDLTRALNRLKDGAQSLAPFCGDAGTRTWVALRRAVHTRFVDARIRLLEAYHRALAGEAQLGLIAMACLTCAAERPSPIRGFLTYAAGEDACPPTVGEMNAELQQEATEWVIVVSGHADPQEPGGEELSRRRAENVRKRLLQLGASPSRVRARAMSDAVPIEPPGRAGNRRVDFDRIFSLDLP